jgi:C4-dicarboxylate-specific signal transduction histidine kinase
MAKNGISEKAQLADSLPPVWADRVQLQQVVLNLLLNAIEAMSGMSEGARELLIRTEQTNSDAVLVTVQDSGPGFPPESAQRLFEAFYTTKPGGLGMGSQSAIQSLRLTKADCGRARTYPVVQCSIHPARAPVR